MISIHTEFVKSIANLVMLVLLLNGKTCPNLPASDFYKRLNNLKG